VIANPTMVEGTGLETLCEVGRTPEELVQCLEDIVIQEFNSSNATHRTEILSLHFSNQANAKKIIRLVRE
jgi:hypothetical protein